MANKNELVFHADIGLVGTFVKFDELGTEPGYVSLWYVPRGWFFPKPVKYGKPIHKKDISVLHSTRSEIVGVEKKIIFIYTAEEGSLVKDIIGAKDKKLIEDLMKENQQLKMDVASKKQHVEDSVSGASKAVASARSVIKPGSGDRPPSFFPSSVDDDYGM